MRKPFKRSLIELALCPELIKNNAQLCQRLVAMLIEMENVDVWVCQRPLRSLRTYDDCLAWMFPVPHFPNKYPVQLFCVVKQIQLVSNFPHIHPLDQALPCCFWWLHCEFGCRTSTRVLALIHGFGQEKNMSYPWIIWTSPQNSRLTMSRFHNERRLHSRTSNIYILYITAMKIDMWLYVFTLFIVCRNYQTHCRTSRNSEAPLPGPVQHVDIPKGLTDLELFEKFCLPSIFDDAWNDVSWLGPITLPEPHKYVIYK